MSISLNKNKATPAGDDYNNNDWYGNNGWTTDQQEPDWTFQALTVNMLEYAATKPSTTKTQHRFKALRGEDDGGDDEADDDDNDKKSTLASDNDKTSTLTNDNDHDNNHDHNNNRGRLWAGQAKLRKPSKRAVAREQELSHRTLAKHPSIPKQTLKNRERSQEPPAVMPWQSTRRELLAGRTVSKTHLICLKDRWVGSRPDLP